jgi:large subunit ribosomal protein L35
MSKLKSHKGLLKRVKITASGKVAHKRSGKSHLNSEMRGKRSRQLRNVKLVHKTEAKRMEQMLHTRLRGRNVS